MKNHSPPKTINNSYESPSSGSATSSSSAGDTTTTRFMNMDFINNGYALSNLLLSTSGTTEFNSSLYNTSAEEGIFPNLPSNCPIYAPSYEPEYDYYNQYSTTPLVYSWMPIVPGFSQEQTDNLHKFEHIIKKLHPQPLNISNVSAEGNSSIVSDQNVKFASSLVLNNSDTKQFILNNSNGVSFNHQLDDSCNAMDLNISCNNVKPSETSVNLDLSFNGKIPELTTSNADDNIQAILNSKKEASPEKCVNNESIPVVANEDVVEDEDEKLRNESFELLKQEDCSKMMLINENLKSPEVTQTICDDSQDEDENEDECEALPSTDIHETQNKSDAHLEVKVNPETTVVVDATITKIPSLKDRDDFLLDKFQTSLAELRPPASIASLPLSLSEMIAIYKKNLDKPKESFAPLKSNLMNVPSHPLNETMAMEWPQIMDVKAPGLMYNRSTDCEQIEFMTVKYVERFIKAETASSYNHKVGPASAKKKIEKLKLLTQSPSSRLSHLANRRKVFSSANLKSSTSSTTSHKTFANSKQLLIDKSKLYQKKKRTSAKKKTPGKRKTPKSAKRQILQLPKPESAASSKRALFISPMKSRKDDSTNMTTRLTREIPSRGQLPKRTLFSPPQNSKRKRSPSPDDENKYGKTRRLDSPSRLLKSKSFSIAAGTSTGSLDDHFKKTLYYRTQSEMVLNQSFEGNKSSNIGFRKPFSDTEKKKLLWTASSALQSKQINRDHEKFKEYMSTLCKLVKKVFVEFYNPSKSMSAQMTKFANLMVFYVTQGRPFDEIYLMTKNKLEAQNPTKVSGYIGHEEYQRNHFIRKNSSLLLMSNSCSSMNLTESNDSILDATFDRSGSDTSLNRSTSKHNDSNVLRENFSSNARDNSTKKLFSGSDSNLNTLLKTSTPSSNVLKAKRQISF